MIDDFSSFYWSFVNGTSPRANAELDLEKKSKNLLKPHHPIRPLLLIWSNYPVNTGVSLCKVINWPLHSWPIKFNNHRSFMSLWYTFKLSLNLEVVAKNGMRKNATEQHHLLIYTMHDISLGFLKQRDRYKNSVATTTQSPQCIFLYLLLLHL